VYSLFGGEKDKDENGDEAPSKVLANIKWPETLETDFIYSEKTINFPILK